MKRSKKSEKEHRNKPVILVILNIVIFDEIWVKCNAVHPIYSQ